MELAIDMTRVARFLVELLNTPSPTGYHHEAMAYVQKALGSLDVPWLWVEENTKGALVAALKGERKDAPRALAAHVDTLGAMVREVKSNGRLMLTQLGSYAWNAIEGEGVTVHCVNGGRRYRGTVQTVTPSVHTSEQMREGKRDDERMEVRLDARTSGREETLALGIDVGDFVFIDPRVEVTDTGFVKSRFLDDKAGTAVIYGALLAMKQAGLRCAQKTTFLVTNYEEVGHGAATGIPDSVVELLVVDMAASTSGEHQNSDEYSVGICAKDSGGPYDLDMRRKLMRLCRQNSIPYRVDTYPHYGSDGTAFLHAGGDVRVGLVGPGVDASHAYERTHITSLEATIRLVVHYLVDAEQ
jgi:putative aminopeptidase FrvX